MENKKQNKYKISIIVPIYSVEEFLDRCIQSIVNQTYRNLEIILVDDGSPDSCPEKCNEWKKKDKRIKVVHKENEGLGYARNTGFYNATGDYICFVDGDDYIEFDAIEKGVSIIKQFEYDLLIFEYKKVNINENTLAIYEPNPPKKEYFNQEIVNDFLPGLIINKWNTIMSAWCCLYNTKVLRRCSFQFVSEREVISEDVYSLLALYKHLKSIKIIENPLYNYRLNKKSITHTLSKNEYIKIKDFYIKSIKLCRHNNYNIKIEESLAKTYYSYTIATLKKIVESDKNMKNKIDLIKEIIQDQFLINILKKINVDTEKKIIWIFKNIICLQNPYVVLLAVKLKLIIGGTK